MTNDTFVYTAVRLFLYISVSYYPVFIFH